MILVILIFLVLVCLVKVSNNHDLIKANCKTPEATANVKNAKKVFNREKYSIAFFAIGVLLIIFIVICQFTTLDTIIINYFSADFYTEDFFNSYLYYIPAFILVSRKILVEVKMSEFLHKYFEVVEEEISSAEVLKSILYKKKPAATPPSDGKDAKNEDAVKDEGATKDEAKTADVKEEQKDEAKDEVKEEVLTTSEDSTEVLSEEKN